VIVHDALTLAMGSSRSTPDEPHDDGHDDKKASSDYSPLAADWFVVSLEPDRNADLKM
jgi:hypothetical protein